MFRFLKYLFVMNRLRHAKSALVIFITSFILLVLFLFIASDIGVYVNSDDKSVWLISKWAIVIILILAMGIGMRRIFTLFTRPFGGDQENFDSRKEALLTKEVLYGKSERIIAKYKKANQ